MTIPDAASDHTRCLTFADASDSPSSFTLCVSDGLVWRALASAGVRVFVGRDLSRKRERKKFIVIAGGGDPCPRCGEPMQIREYDGVDEELPSQPFFTRWFCCMNRACKTTLVMPARYKIDLDSPVSA
jgi:hypothetical protein